jgi:thioredoxin 1
MSIDTPIHTNEQSIDRVLGTGKPVLLVFWHQGCAPCSQLNPALDRLALAYAGKALIVKVNVHDNPTLPRRFNITRLPGLVFVKDGKPVAQTRGMLPEAELRAWLEHLVAGGPRPALSEGPSVPLDDAPAERRQPPPQGAPGIGAPIVLTDATFDQAILGELPVLVDFWAPWCGPCRVIAPVVERLGVEFAGRARVAKLNVDENPAIAQRYAITSIPALFVFKDGEVKERLFGTQPESVLRQALARHVGEARAA